MGGDFPADFKQPGPEFLWFPAPGLRAGERDHLGPGHDLGGEHDQMAPEFVAGEGLQGQVRQSGVFGIADPVFTPGSEPVAYFQVSELPLRLVRGDRCVPVPVNVSDPQLRPHVGDFLTNDDPHPGRPR